VSSCFMRAISPQLLVGCVAKCGGTLRSESRPVPEHWSGSQYNRRCTSVAAGARRAWIARCTCATSRGHSRAHMRSAADRKFPDAQRVTRGQCTCATGKRYEASPVGGPLSDAPRHEAGDAPACSRPPPTASARRRVGAAEKVPNSRNGSIRGPVSGPGAKSDHRRQCASSRPARARSRGERFLSE